MTISYANNPVQSIWGVFNWDTPNIMTGVRIGGPIPAGGRILRASVHVLTAFNATSSNVISVGIAAAGSEMAVNFSVATIGEFPFFAHFTSSSLQSPLSSSRSLFVKYFGAGASAATAGKAVISVLYTKFAG